MRRREAVKALPPPPPAELMQPAWRHQPTYAQRVAACDQWVRAREAWLAGYGWTGDELSDLLSVGRQLPGYLGAFVEAGWSAPFDPDSI